MSEKRFFDNKGRTPKGKVRMGSRTKLPVTSIAGGYRIVADGERGEWVTDNHVCLHASIAFPVGVEYGHMGLETFSSYLDSYSNAGEVGYIGSVEVEQGQHPAYAVLVAPNDPSHFVFVPDLQYQVIVAAVPGLTWRASEDVTSWVIGSTSEGKDVVVVQSVSKKAEAWLSDAAAMIAEHFSALAVATG